MKLGKRREERGGYTQTSIPLPGFLCLGQLVEAFDNKPAEGIPHAQLGFLSDWLRGGDGCSSFSMRSGPFVRQWWAENCSPGWWVRMVVIITAGITTM